MKRSALILTLSGLVVAAMPAAAGDGIWTPLGPDGAQVTALAVAPSDPGVVYAGAYSAGIYKSTDGGATWSFAGRGAGFEAVTAIAVDPVHSGTVYAAAESGAVFKTTDGGAGWSRVWTGAPTNSLVIDPRRPHIVLAGTFAGLYRSTDGGATWARRGRQVRGGIDSLAYDAAGGWLYAGFAGHGLLRSFNQGLTWEAAGAGLPNQPLRSLALDPERPKTLLVTTLDGLYRSADRGTHWQMVSSPSMDEPMAVVFQRRGRAWASFLTGVFRSEDRGATWRRASILPGRSGGAIPALAAGPEVVYAGLVGDLDGPGLYRTLDGGASWQPAVDGLQGHLVTAVAVDPSDAQALYAAANTVSVFKTRDGGGTWTQLHLTDPFGWFLTEDILIDPARPATVWLAGSGTPGVLCSEDAGATWFATGEGAGPLSTALDPRAPDALWGAGWNGVLHSADGGATWERRELNAEGSLHFEHVEVDPHDPAVVYAAGEVIIDGAPPRHQPAVFRSADGGVTWERRDAGINSGIDGPIVVDLAVDATDPATLYAATLGRLFRSTDAGLSWAPAPGLTGSVYVTVATAPAGPDTPAAVYTARQLPVPSVLRSTDRGETWRSIRRGLAPAIPQVLAVDPTDPAHLLLGTSNRSLLSYTLGGVQ